MPSEAQTRSTISEFAGQAVRSQLPRFEAKIHRVLDRVWGNGREATA